MAALIADAPAPAASSAPGASGVALAHVVLSLRIGGLERVVVDLVNHAAPSLAPLVVCLEQAGDMAGELRRTGARVLELHRRPGLRPWLALRVRRELRRHGVRLVHTHNTAAGLYGGLAGRLCRLPVVHTKHGQNLTGEPSQGRMNRVVYGVSDHVVAVSPAALALALSEGARPERLSLIDNGIDVDRFVEGQAERERARRDLALAPDAFVVGTVARLAPEKDQATLLAAFAGALAAAPQGGWTLVLVGGGPLEAALRSEAETRGIAGRVRFTGPRGDVARLLPAFDVFAMSSLSEGLPVALLEAMAAGVPPVVTRVGAMAEVVAEGRAGLVVPPGDPAALASALECLRGDEAGRAALGRAAAQRVREVYGARRMAREYEAVYSRLLGRALD